MESPPFPFLGPNILLNTVFSNTLSFLSNVLFTILKLYFNCTYIINVVLDCAIIYILLTIENTTTMLHPERNVFIKGVIIWSMV